MYYRGMVSAYEPLTRYVKLRVAYAPGMPGTFSPAAEFKGNRELAIPACITARASSTCRDACRDCLPLVVGKTFPAFPTHAHPQFDVFGKRPMHGILVLGRCDDVLPSRNGSNKQLHRNLIPTMWQKTLPWFHFNFYRRIGNVDRLVPINITFDCWPIYWHVILMWNDEVGVTCLFLSFCKYNWVCSIHCITHSFLMRVIFLYLW